MSTAFEGAFSRAYSKLEDYMGRPATYVSPDRSVSASITIIGNELIGALDGLAQTTMHVRASSSFTFERGGQITTTDDGVIWDVIDSRDSTDGTLEVRCSTPIIIGS